MRGGWFAALCAGLVLLSTPARSDESSTTVVVESGTLQGLRRDTVDSFKGIPYAAPPLGSLRWEPPQPVTSWQGVRDAASYGNDCMQEPMPRDAAPLRTKPSEDCLYLNVWRTAGGGSRLPVMVWIHGGGFTNGGTSPVTYDGAQFARDGVILVSMNYRLGRFGFFGFPALTASHPDGLLGNYGYLDQIAALKWVKRNIAAFGGDPNNVTVFGESAGGGSVHMLLISPLAAGLFNKAIIESGGGRTRVAGPVRQLSQDLPGLPSADTLGVSFAKSHGIKGSDADALAKLRALPADDVVDGLAMNATSGESSSLFSGPVQDGKIVAGLPDDVYRSGQFAHVPLMIGANSFDLGFNPAKSINEALAPFGADRDRARAVYDPSGSGNLYVVAWSVMMDRLMVEPARFTAQQFSSQGVPVYEYRFSYVSRGATQAFEKGLWAGLQYSNPQFWEMMTKNAVHASEIPYVFDTVTALYGSLTTASDKSMAAIMHAHWINFARRGDPNDPIPAPGVPQWPAYSTNTDMLMNFAQQGPKPMPDPWKDRLDLTAAHAN